MPPRPTQPAFRSSQGLSAQAQDRLPPGVPCPGSPLSVSLSIWLCFTRFACQVKNCSVAKQQAAFGSGAPALCPSPSRPAARHLRGVSNRMFCSFNKYKLFQFYFYMPRSKPQYLNNNLPIFLPT